MRCPHCRFEIDPRGMHKHIRACEKRDPKERKTFAGRGIHALAVARHNGRGVPRLKREPQIEIQTNGRRIQLQVSISYDQFRDLLAQMTIEKVEVI